jgi:hypothetical protein
MQKYVIEVKVAVLWGEHRAIWLTDASTFQGSLPSPILWKKSEGWNRKGTLWRRQC